MQFRRLIIAGLLLLTAVSAFAQVPRSVFVEFATATW